MFNFDGILANVFAGLQEFLASGILSFFTNLLGSLLGGVFPSA